MLNRILDLGHTAVDSGSRAVRLLLDLAMMASNHLRQRIGLGQEPRADYETRPIASPEPAPRAPATQSEEAASGAAPEPSEAASEAAPEPSEAAARAAAEPSEVAPEPSEAASEAAPAPRSSRPAPKKKGGGSKARTARKAQGSKGSGGKGGKRPDQMIRVLEILASGDRAWMSAKEISDAGEAAGKPILPGNVRKVIRARGKDLVETRPRKGSRRGAMEYRITPSGRKKLGG